MTRPPVARAETDQVLWAIDLTLREYRHARTGAAVERVLRTATASGRPVAADPCVGGPGCGCRTWTYVAPIPLMAGGPCKCTPICASCRQDLEPWRVSPHLFNETGPWSQDAAIEAPTGGLRPSRKVPADG